MSAPRLELDYLAPRRRAGWAGIVLLGLSLAMAAHLVVRYRDALQEQTRLAANALLAQERAPARPVPRERVERETKAVEAVVRQLTVPWATLVGALEEAALPDVALLQLQPDAGERRLRLSAEARDRNAMFAYLSRLEQAPAFAAVHLVSHEVQSDDPLRPIRFSLQAMLR